MAINHTNYIRAEMGRVKEEQEKTWSEPTNRTIYQWSETSKTKDGTLTTKQTAWTQAVRNRMQQKAGEIQAYRAYEKGAEKWCNEHIPQKGTSLRKDMSYWKTRIDGGTIHPFSKDATSPGRGRELMKTARSCSTRKDQSRQRRLVPPDSQNHERKSTGQMRPV